MAAASKPRYRELTWVEPEKPDAPFIMRDGERDVGWLRFDHEEPGRALGEMHGRRFIFERSDLLHPRVVVHEEGLSELLE